MSCPRPLFNLRAVAALTGLLLLAACASPPVQTDGIVLSALTPRSAVLAPMDEAQTEQQTVLWGGMILSGANLPNVTRLEVLAYPLDRVQRPIQARDAEGRFFLDIDGYVETADYAEGRLITVLGSLAGIVDGTVGEASYHWPRVVGEQWHLWRPGDEHRSPRFTFGIGVNLSN